MNKQILEIVDVLQKIAGSDYDARASLFGESDELDAIAIGLNMLCEEVQATITELNETKSRLTKSNSFLTHMTNEFKSQKEYIERLLNIVPSAVFTVDKAKKITSWNKRAEEISGYTEDEILGKECSFFLQSPCKDICGLFESKTDSTIIGSECSIKTKNGLIKHISKNTCHLIDEKNTLIGGVESFDDFTDKKRIAQELDRSNKELVQFAYIASHDLQEPLRKVQAFGSRLSDKYSEVLDEKGLDYLARMQSAASRMQNMVNDLLTYSRVTTQAKPFEMVDLNEILNNSMDDLYLQISKSNAMISKTNLPVIEGDSIQISQVFNNLISNSIKYVKKDVSPVIDISVKNNHNHSTTLIFNDNGIGFNMEFTDLIFQAFQRLHGRQEYDGTGIGLSVVKKIIERHRGKIWAESSPGTGSTFFVQLPIRQDL
ncbi:MAG: PAS domain S-box protein [Bacteroidales bacterium]|nr:PAS domain S-box protein [Bacteroidales bacterium]